MDETKAARSIQAVQRGKTARRERAQQSAGARRIQAIQRGKAQRKADAQRRASAAKIQSMQRGKRLRAEQAARQARAVRDAAADSLGYAAVAAHPLLEGTALVSLSARGRGLTPGGLDALAEAHPRLQKLDVAENQLTTLKALATMPFLHTLDAAGNRLERVLGCDCPDHRLGDATRDCNTGSSLLHADLSRNRIAWIDGLLVQRHPRLMTLCLDGNRLASLRGLLGGAGAGAGAGKVACLPFLHTLSVRDNTLVDLEGTQVLPHLRCLRADGNRITSLRSLRHNPELFECTLGGNELADVDGLEACTSLNALDLSNNRLATVRAIESLDTLAHLNKLDLRGNPAADSEPYAHFRWRVLVRLQGLTRLDDVAVSSEDKVKAFVAHGSELDERVKRWQKHLPGVDFENHCPILEDV